MKKILLILTIMLAVFVLASCGSETSASTDGTTTAQTTEAVTTAAAPEYQAYLDASEKMTTLDSFTLTAKSNSAFGAETASNETMMKVIMKDKAISEFSMNTPSGETTVPTYYKDGVMYMDITMAVGNETVTMKVKQELVGEEFESMKSSVESEEFKAESISDFTAEVKDGKITFSFVVKKEAIANDDEAKSIFEAYTDVIEYGDIKISGVINSDGYFESITNEYTLKVTLNGAETAVSEKTEMTFTDFNSTVVTAPANLSEYVSMGQ